MITLIQNGVYLLNGMTLVEKKDSGSIQVVEGQKDNDLSVDISKIEQSSARKSTIAYKILTKHNTVDDIKNLKIRFDGLASHDITYVGIVQTARASGLREFPIPYVLTNCHNSLCAVGGTINEDDHIFGLSAAQKYGGIYVPANQAVIHQYMREMMTSCGTMILGSDSHTRYGALGTMGIGEGGPELVKQLLKKTYDVKFPDVIGVYLKGTPKRGVGPQDVALAIIGAVFKNKFVKNKVLEFIGPGIQNLSVDFRNGIDVMTTETTCLSSIWATDNKVKEYYEVHGRPNAYCQLNPEQIAYYDGMIVVDLDKVEPMIALPFHPSNVYTVAELNKNTYDILKMAEQECLAQMDIPSSAFSLTDKIVNGKLKVDQGIVAGCAGGTYENLYDVAAMVDAHSIGNGEFSLSVYPASQPVYYELIKNGSAEKLMNAGIVIKPAFCGPCFGAGDTPANGSLSIRHSTRNFPNREGSKPTDGQIASVALMDARTIAATAINGGYLTPATELEYKDSQGLYSFNKDIYTKRVYDGFGSPELDKELKLGPNITDWPKMSKLPENLLLKVASVINDPVTTTDELIPSGETSSYRSNPLKLAEFTLQRKDPTYVQRAKDFQKLEKERKNFLEGQIDEANLSQEIIDILNKIVECNGNTESIEDVLGSTGFGSVIYAFKPGDGSAREQAASCQKVLGGWANIAVDYATKRYRSNLINWGILPFTVDDMGIGFEIGDLIYISGLRSQIKNNVEKINVQIIRSNGISNMELSLNDMTSDEREIILKGCLINYYTHNKK